MSPENKAKIDGMSWEELKAYANNAKPGDELLKGESGVYFTKVMDEKFKIQRPEQAIGQ